MNAAIPREIFRAYDIRGIAGELLDDDILRQLGRAIASEALDLGENSLVVCADARLSSPAFHRALIEGVLATGCDVIDIGTLPTPLLYFATHQLAAGSGVMVTGSHNPKEYNGLKIVLRRQCLADRQIDDLRRRLIEGDLHHGRGRLHHQEILPAYLARIAGDLRLRRRYQLVVDCGNAVPGLVAPQLYEALGCRVRPLFCEPDGNFPNHHPDPSVPANLAQLVREVRGSGADLGIAFDGDGDRVGLVTASGRLVEADRLLMCFARDILPANPGARVVFDVKSSHHLARLVEEAGGEPLLCKSGHSFVKRRMEESGALLGGEYSAHIFFRHRWYGFDDGLYCAARFLELMDRRGLSADQLLDELPGSVSTPELFLPVPEADKFALMERLARVLRFPDAGLYTLDGVRAHFDRGWGLLRASNTGPNLVLRFEADSHEDLAAIQARFREALLSVDESLALPF